MRDDLRNHGLMGVSTSVPVPTVVPVNGQDSVFGILNDNVVAFDTVKIEPPASHAFTKATIPAGLTTLSNRVCFSPDKIYMAVLTATAAGVALFKKVSGVYTAIAGPNISPGASTTYAEFSPDGNYLAISLGIAPYIYIAKRTGDAFNKLANPEYLPTSMAFDVSWDPTSTYLAVSYSSTPAFIVYKRTADVFAKLADPAEVPYYGSGNCIAWSPDGTYLAVGMSQISFQWIYKRVGDVLTKINTNSINLPISSVMDLAWSDDSTYLVFGGTASPHLVILKRTADTFAMMPSPMNLPNAAVSALAFSHDGNYLVVAMNIAPFTMLYDHAGDSFTEAGNAPPAKTIFNVTSYGAVADGTTDCRTAINNAFTAASAANGIVYFPPASLPYLISSYIYLLSNVEVWGYGATVYKNSVASAAGLMFYRSNAVYISNVKFKGLTLKSINNVAGSGEYLGCMTSYNEGISIYGVDGLTIKDVVMDALYMGLKLQAPTTGLNQNIEVDNLQTKNTRNPIYFSDTTQMNVKNSIFDATGGGTKYLHALYARGNVSTCTFDNCKFQNTPGGGIHLYAASGAPATEFVFNNCEIDECRAGVYLYSGANDIIFNNLKIKRAGTGLKVNVATDIHFTGLEMTLFSIGKEEVNGIYATSFTNSTIDHCKVDAATMDGPVVALISGCSGITLLNFTGINMGGDTFTTASGVVASLINKNLALGNALSEHYDITGTSSPTIPAPPPLPDRIFPALPGQAVGVEFNSDSTEIGFGLVSTPFMALFTHDYLDQIYKTTDISDLVGASGAGYVKEVGLIGAVVEVTRIFR